MRQRVKQNEITLTIVWEIDRAGLAVGRSVMRLLL